jgi:hypothetical protein
MALLLIAPVHNTDSTSVKLKIEKFGILLYNHRSTTLLNTLVRNRNYYNIPHTRRSNSMKLSLSRRAISGSVTKNGMEPKGLLLCSQESHREPDQSSTHRHILVFP